MISHGALLEGVRIYVGVLHQSGVYDEKVIEAAVFARFRYYAVVSTKDIKACIEASQRQITVTA